MMGATMLSAPEFIIDDKQAKLLGDAIRNVAGHYELGVMSEKNQAWVNLMMVGCGVYGTRAMAYRNRMKAEKDKAKPATPKPIEFPSAQPPRARAAGGAPAGFTPSDIFGRTGPTDDE